MNPFERTEYVEKEESRYQDQLGKADDSIYKTVVFMAYDQRYVDKFCGSIQSIKAQINIICLTAVILEIDGI